MNKTCWGDLPIETERLILKPPLSEDIVDAMTAAKRETWPQLHQWMVWAKGDAPDHEQDLVVLKENEEKFYRGEDCMLIGFDKTGGLPLVFTGLHNPDWDRRVFEIGYWVCASAQGQGYAQETTRALIGHAFNNLNAGLLKISHAAGNDASRAIIEKCGFQYTHTIEADVKDGGRTTWHYALRP